MPTNDFDPGLPTFQGPHTAENPGYEVEDVNVGGIVTFVGGLAAFVVVFFFFCFLMGKIINYKILELDGPTDKWHAQAPSLGSTPHGEKREDLTSNAAMEQKQLAEMANSFPGPRMQADDGNQDTADLHAREDLLLDNYSSGSDLPAGEVRIPIERAMQLVVERGLPKPATAVAEAPLMVGETKPMVSAPLTTGFARTGYEQQTIEARNQKNEYEKAEKAEK
jgi:hypothetical protein